MVVVVGALMVLRAARDQHDRLRLLRVGIPAVATIIRLKWDEQAEYLYSIYRFRTPHYGWIVAPAPKGSGPLKGSLGQSVPIFYHPDNPRQFITGNDTLLFGTVLDALAGLGIIGFCLYLFYRKLG